MPSEKKNQANVGREMTEREKDITKALIEWCDALNVDPAELVRESSWQANIVINGKPIHEWAFLVVHGMMRHERLPMPNRGDIVRILSESKGPEVRLWANSILPNVGDHNHPDSIPLAGNDALED